MRKTFFLPWPSYYYVVIKLVICSLLLPLFPLSAQAQQPVKRLLISGTGFFVNQDGYVVTNAHVVTNCARLTVVGPVPEIFAEQVARDSLNDLVILKTGAMPPAYAEFRSVYFPVLSGERAISVGFPGGGPLTTREAKILDVTGPNGESQWLQFSDSVKEGNSGGPLLDDSAKVIGVVLAKAELYRHNPDAGRDDILKQMDIAIQNTTLKDFLTRNHVRFRENGSGGGGLAAHRVEDRAREFVVNVRCLQ